MEKLLDENRGLFSIVIPSYYHEKYIVDCLDSIISQTYKRIEVVMIDDASRDRTFELAISWREQHKDCFERFVIIKNDTNIGVVKTVNRALEESKGEYIIRLASDDCLLPNVIEDIVEEFNINQETYMIAFNGYVGEKYSQVFTESEKLTRMYDKGFYDTNHKDFFEELYRNDFISAPGVVIRREAYLDLGVYDEASPIDDWEYYLRVALHKEPIFSEKCIVFFRHVSDSLSHSSSCEKRIMMNNGVLYVTEKYSGDVNTRVASIEKKVKYNLVLREALDWEDLTYAKEVRNRMRRKGIPLTARCRLKCLVKGFFY